MIKRSKHDSQDDLDRDGNAIGLTEAFAPVSEDGFTQQIPAQKNEQEASAEAGADDGADPADSSPARATDDSADTSETAPRGHEANEAPATDGGFSDGAVAEDGVADQSASDGSDASDALSSGGASSQDLPEQKLGTITEAPKAVDEDRETGEKVPRHGKHASDSPKKEIPEYMRKSRRTRRVLIVAIVVLVLLLGGITYYVFSMASETGNTVEQQIATESQDVEAIQPDEASDASTETAKTTTVPNLVQLLGLTEEQAVEKLQHGAQVSSTRTVKERGNPIRKESRVALTAEPADARTGTPTVYLGYNKKGKIIQAGYSASTSSLGYGSLSFADAVRNEGIIQKTLGEAGVLVPDEDVVLPEDASEYTTFDSDGKTRTKEYCSFSGEADVDGKKHTWSAVLSYDYSMANASGNLADTVRTIFVYVNS